jgi:Pentapeptide repeats (8 copies)
MANPDHIAQLMRCFYPSPPSVPGGSAAWNAWRYANPREPLDLSQENLSAANLSGVDLVGADLRQANLEEADSEGMMLKISNIFG